MTATAADNVQQTSTSTGTGNLTLASLNGRRSFSSAFGTGSTPDVFYYFISSASAAEWEVGSGHMSAVATLVRDTVIESSNANLHVSFGAGLKYVCNDLPASVQTDGFSRTASTFSTLTAARAATIPAEVNVVTTLGYRALNDRGGATYIRAVGATFVPIGGFVDAGGGYWALGETTATTRMFGAYADGTLHTISSGDIAANPQWMGPHTDTGATMYAAGYDSWDSVAAQELTYWGLAGTSTPGVSRAFSWNTSNRPMLASRGVHIINRRLLASGYYFSFNFENRGNTVFEWRGTLTVVGNTDGSTGVITNVTTPMGQIEKGQFVKGLGVAPGSKVTAFDTVARTITLSKNTTSAHTQKQMIAFASMMLWNGVSYFEADNITLNVTQGHVIPRANPNDTGFMSDDNLPSFTSLWTIDGDANKPTITFPHNAKIDTCNISGGAIVDVGISISPSGNGAQGDNINFFNPSFFSFQRSAIQLGGNNVFATGIFKGDFEGCRWDALTSFGGSYYVWGTQFEDFTYTSNGPPYQSQIVTFGADINLRGGGGTSDIIGVRSEGSILCRSEGDFAVVRNCQAQAADFGYPPRTNSTGFLPGFLVQSTNNNISKRAFVLVDTGYQNDWHSMSASAGPTDTITDPDAAYTPGGLVGKTLFVRTDFTAKSAVITANTATTITAAGIQVTPQVYSIYIVTGKSAVAEPNWESASAGSSFETYGFSTDDGITLTAGSVTAYCSTKTVVNVNDYIMVPAGDLIGVDVSVSSYVPQQVYAFFAKVTATAAGGPQGTILTLSRAPARSGSKVPFYWGAGLADGDLTWINVDFSAVVGVIEVNNCQFLAGRAARIMRFTNVDFRQVGWYRGDGIGIESFNTIGHGITIDGGLKASAPAVAIDASATPRDVSASMAASNFADITPTMDITLDAANVPPLLNLRQEWTLVVTTSGVTSYTITFGTNFLSTGTLATGVVSGAVIVVKFVSVNGKWAEVSRSAP